MSQFVSKSKNKFKNRKTTANSVCENNSNAEKGNVSCGYSSKLRYIAELTDLFKSSKIDPYNKDNYDTLMILYNSYVKEGSFLFTNALMPEVVEIIKLAIERYEKLEKTKLKIAKEWIEKDLQTMENGIRDEKMEKWVLGTVERAKQDKRLTSRSVKVQEPPVIDRTLADADLIIKQEKKESDIEYFKQIARELKEAGEVSESISIDENTPIPQKIVEEVKKREEKGAEEEEEEEIRPKEKEEKKEEKKEENKEEENKAQEEKEAKESLDKQKFEQAYLLDVPKLIAKYERFKSINSRIPEVKELIDKINYIVKEYDKMINVPMNCEKEGSEDEIIDDRVELPGEGILTATNKVIEIGNKMIEGTLKAGKKTVKLVKEVIEKRNIINGDKVERFEPDLMMPIIPGKYPMLKGMMSVATGVTMLLGLPGATFLSCGGKEIVDQIASTGVVTTSINESILEKAKDIVQKAGNVIKPA